MNNPNHSNQMNSNNKTYWTDRGESERPSDWASRPHGGDDYQMTKNDSDNKSNQGNPNNSTYHSSRGTTKP